jgi:hypothetical protein
MSVLRFGRRTRAAAVLFLATLALGAWALKTYDESPAGLRKLENISLAELEEELQVRFPEISQLSQSRPP